MENRNLYIMSNIRDKYLYLEEHGYKVLGIFLQGSQNYGLDIYDEDYKSDIDAKAIVLPSLRDIVLNKTPVSTTIVLPNDEHIEVKDIRIMREIFVKQNISYLELLYTEFYLGNDKYKKYVKELQDMKDEISSINKNQLLKAIKGMSMNKLIALEHPYPTIVDKIEKYGYDPKQLHHIVRLNEFVGRYLLDGESFGSCYISKMHNDLIDIKKGCYSLEVARSMANTFNDLTHKVCDEHITEEDNVNISTIYKLDDWIMRVITESLKDELGVQHG